MKHGILLLSILFTVLSVSTSCNNKENGKTSLETSNIIFHKCDQNAKLDIDKKTVQVVVNEAVSYTAMNNGYLHIEHRNAILNCCAENISIEASLNGNNITVNEKDDDNQCACLCKNDVIFDLGPFVEGTHYTMVINDRLTFKFTYSPQLKSQFNAPVHTL